MAFKIFGELKIVKPGVGFELMAYRFKVLGKPSNPLYYAVRWTIFGKKLLILVTLHFIVYLNKQ